MLKSLSIKKAINSADNSKTNNEQVYNIEAIQAELLKIYQDVFDACEKHGLKLFLQGGTLLGKVRHDGFIPWDDDMDLGLSRDDYEKLQSVYENELKDRYLLYMPGSNAGSRTRFAQFVKKDDVKQNLWLDVFPVDYAPKSSIGRLLKGLRCTCLTAITSSFEFIEYCDTDMRKTLMRTKMGKVNYTIRKLLCGIFSYRSLQCWFIKLDRAACGREETEFCTSSMGRRHYIGEMQMANVFYPLRKSSFCGIDAWILNDSKEYLRHNYGEDFMIVPPKEEREMHRR